MGQKQKTFTIEIHYYLNQDGYHFIDAYTHNKCERELLHAIRHLAVTYGQKEYAVELGIPEEGGYKDVLKFIYMSAPFLCLFQTFLNYHFSPALNSTVEIKERIEAAKALKEGNFTEEQAKILVDGDEKLEKFTSAYYKSLNDCPSISSVECSVLESANEKDTMNNKKKLSVIQRKDFSTHIITNKTVSYDSLKTTIKIISPVLFQQKGLKWRGKYNGEPIVFAVEDNDFLTQVSNREIKFEAGTTLDCDIHITDSQTLKGEKILKSCKKYVVKKVHSWVDGNNLRTETKRLRKE